MHRLILAAMLLPMAACAPVVSRDSGPGDLRLGEGYRSSSDPCRIVGYSDVTAPFMSSKNDLVGCPAGYKGQPLFQHGTGGREVTRTDGWVIYRVPLYQAQG